MGWTGLILFMLGLAGLWWRLVRGLRRMPREQQTVAMRASCALLPAYAITLLTDNTINYASGFGIIVYTLAALALNDIAERSKAAVVHREPRVAAPRFVHEGAATSR